jgi:membrane protease subunit (stomatin/prohibitin family)
MAVEKVEGKIKGWALVTMTLQVQAQLPVQAEAAAAQNRCHRKKKQQYLTMCGREITGRKGAMCDATTSSNAVHL